MSKSVDFQAISQKYSKCQYIHIYIYIYIYICREGQLTHLFFPGRVGRGYGPDWTLVVVVVVSPAQKITFLKSGSPSPGMGPRGPGAPNNLISGGLRAPDMIYDIIFWGSGGKINWLINSPDLSLFPLCGMAPYSPSCISQTVA